MSIVQRTFLKTFLIKNKLWMNDEWTIMNYKLCQRWWCSLILTFVKVVFIIYKLSTIQTMFCILFFWLNFTQKNLKQNDYILKKEQLYQISLTNILITLNMTKLLIMWTFVIFLIKK